MRTLALALALAITSLTAVAQISKFDHIVVVFQENRTPDNLFQGLCKPPYGSQATCSTSATTSQYNIQTHDWLDSTSSTGVSQPGTVALSAKYDLSHAHSAFVGMCDANPATGACQMDGAAHIKCSGKCVKSPQFKYVNNSNGLLNPYLDLATQYGWANYMFQTNQGPSFPAHQFMFGGTSAPSAADDKAGIFASENMTNTGTGGLGAAAGCAAQASTTVALIDSNGNENQKIFPCFEHQTIADVLPSTFSWRYYAPSAGSIWTAPNAIQHICESTGAGGSCAGKQWTDNVDLKPADVLTDIGNCNLRSLSWVIPTGANSDHANANDGGGPSWVAAIVNAIGQSSSCDGGSGYWNNTAIILTWDDWGGWYDHEAPPFLTAPEGAYQYGFRVPLLVISAYTPAGFINNQFHDFGTVLRFIEKNFGVPEGALTFADARATTNLGLFFKLNQSPRVFKPIAAPKGPAFFLNDKRKPTDPDDDR